VAADSSGTLARSLTVIIATYQRERALHRCLQALTRQTLALSEWEVVVVVDGSTDGTLDMLRQHRWPFALNVIEQLNQGHAAALNTGLGAARGRYCLFLDDDIVVDADCLHEHARAQGEYGGVIAMGRLTCSLPPEADGLAHFVAEWWDDRHGDLSRLGRKPMATDCIIANTSVPRDALIAVGGVTTDLSRGFDTDLGARLQAHELCYVYVPLAVGCQDYKKGYDDVVTDVINEGTSAWALYLRHPHLLPHMPLGAYSEGPARALALRSALLLLRVPPSSLQWVGRILRGTRWNREWYRCVYGLCYWTGVRRALPSKDVWNRLTRGPVLLMYHAFGNSGEPASRYVVPIRRFRQQLAWLKRRRYRVLSLQELIDMRARHRLPPSRSVVITIDDGYSDAEALALPALQRAGFPATLFVVTGFVGNHNQWTEEPPLKGRELADWNGIRKMAREGMQVAAHTQSHPHLPAVNLYVAEQEIAGSRRDLKGELRAFVDAFAYPFGEYTDDVRGLVRELGFRVALGVREGPNSAATPHDALRRIEVRGTDSFLRFVLAARFGYSRPVRRLIRR